MIRASEALRGVRALRCSFVWLLLGQLATGVSLAGCSETSADTRLASEPGSGLAGGSAQAAGQGVAAPTSSASVAADDSSGTGPSVPVVPGAMAGAGGSQPATGAMAAGAAGPSGGGPGTGAERAMREGAPSTSPNVPGDEPQGAPQDAPQDGFEEVGEEVIGEPGGAQQGESAAALLALRDHLERARDARPPLAEQPFAQTPLTSADAEAAREALWEDLAQHIRQTRGDEHAAERITLDGVTLRYETVPLGEEPPGGRDLFISMHGGGSAPAATNDAQWRNQVSLATGYDPVDSLWVAPRAPTDDWNMWFKDHIDDLFDRLITNMIVFEGVNPDRVYLTGYSAGGDGVYGLAPRTADRWAGAGMSAGHPNGVSIDNLRNVAFALHAGGNDRAFDRHLVTQTYIDELEALQAEDPDGYPHQGRVHPGLPHWMNLADAVSIPFMQMHTRSSVPQRVVWEQHERTHPRMYWLAVPPSEVRAGSRVVASVTDQTITLEEADGVSVLFLRLRDDMLDLDRPVVVVRDGTTEFEGTVSRTIAALWRTLAVREDPSLVYPATLRLELASQ
ncbi:MAG: hypothetical protein OXU20_21240 [Myxococcales bacterium]|nr:hypothetical protein [Myxococcales bacterium]